MEQLTALVTGATDGIGKATAIALAENGYTVHILGRNRERGQNTLNQLKKVSPEKDHQLFLVDLSTITSNQKFIQEYTTTYHKLDLLILNALAFPYQGIRTKEGYDLTFAVGYLSRYLFSMGFDSILQQGKNARVLHIGQGSLAGNVDFDKVKNPIKLGQTYSLSDKIKVTYNAYKADGLFTHFVNQRTNIKTPHEYYHPGTVDTQQVKDGPKIVRFLGKLFGAIISPQKSGNILVQHIKNTQKTNTASQYYSLGKLQKHKARLLNSEKYFDTLIRFSEELTNVSLPLENI